MATFHHISSQNLECPICLALFNQPKSLTCSHTFCKGCLQRIFQTQPEQQTITCPVCRKETPIPSGDASKLQTNIPLSSLVDEVKTKSPTCTACKMDENPPAVSYCQDCGKYMCKSCDSKHSSWAPFSTHTVTAMSEILSGKVPIKRRLKCKNHPNDDKEFFCTGCREYVCLRCGMLRHLQAGHHIEEAAIHEEKLMTIIKELQKEAKSKTTSVENHIDFIQTQRNEIANIIRRLNNCIDKTYEEYIKLLSARRETLKCQVKQWSEKFEKELQTMEEESHQTIRKMKAMEELVANGVKVPLEKDTVIAHDTLCENLKSFLGRVDPDDQSPRGVTEGALKISFRRYVKVNELCLGNLEGYTWDVKADVELPVKDCMECMARAPDGKMAVGSGHGGVHLYSPDGELQQTVLKDIYVSEIGSLSYGRIAVCDTNNEMSLYTSQWEKLDVSFETMGREGGIAAGLTVDRDDNIYVSYWKSKKIQVFTPQGGKAVREIMCDGYKASQLFSFPSTGKLIVSDLPAVVCIDGNGKKEHILKKEGMFAFPAVCRDDSVIVAWVKREEGLVSIDRYTKDLEHVHNIITDFKIQPKRGWCYLQEFESGEIAFCTRGRLYIFDV
ncbi:E3 ubiquitin-protein ligase TRIM71-like [Diadema antillarum]|uniref:E3 ubiquitin-protein ligase TRIM71-like n=1 Tax=Diadema antillarum TaxID=105358 RepID=UPI003A8664DC